MKVAVTKSQIRNLTTGETGKVGDLLYEGTGSSGVNPHAVTSVAGTAYTYDDNGNLTSDGTTSYTWNAKNQLESSGNLTFSYDHTGSRYKTVDSSTGTDVSTYYLSPYEEIREATTPVTGTPTYFIFAGSQRVASYEDADGDGSKEFYYYHQDHLGGTSLVTNEDAMVVQLYDYYPYGSELLNSQLSDTEVHHSFTDKELEDNLGLYYFEARWYDSEIGRFLSVDPISLDFLSEKKSDSFLEKPFRRIADDAKNKSLLELENKKLFENGEIKKEVLKWLMDPQLLNTYSYARNNPISYIDQNGLKAASLYDVINSAWDTTMDAKDYIDEWIDSITDVVGGIIDEWSEEDSVSIDYGETFTESGHNAMQEIADEGYSFYENLIETIDNVWNTITGEDARDFDIETGTYTEIDE